MPLKRSLAMVSLLLSVGIPSDAAPVVAGFDRLAAAPNHDEVAMGELLLGELNCTSCHSGGAQQRIWNKSAPDLSAVSARVAPSYIERYLKAPHAAKEGTTMPDIFHSSEAGARDGAVDFLKHYLVSLGEGLPLSGSGGNERLIEQGRELFGTVGCVGCHAPQEGDASLITTPMVPLGDLAAKTSVEALAAFLQDPHAARPSGRMPSLRLEPGEATSIATYLLRDQYEAGVKANSGRAIREAGVEFAYYEQSVSSRLPDFSNMTPKATGVVPNFTLELPIEMRGEQFLVTYKSLITVEEAGNHIFSTRSDDGSKLFINGELVVDNDGDHGMVRKRGELELSKGDHEIEVQFYQAGSGYGLEVAWVTPGANRRGEAIPDRLLGRANLIPMVPTDHADFAVDPTKVQMGRRMFAAMRCVSCHDVPGVEPMSVAKPLAALRLDSSDGCLSDSIRRGLPDYKLSAVQKKAIRAALADRAGLSKPLTSAEIVNRTVAALNCYACHERDGIGGPDAARAELFHSVGEIDLGEEGKIPPTLTGVGAKLRPEALEGILLRGEHHVRHYMASRMPDFGEANLRPFLDHVAKVDTMPNLHTEPEFSEEAVEAGRKLVGFTGLACITCHNIAGQDGPAIQGIDIATAYDRLNPGWFRAFIENPAAFNKDTRMPAFFVGGRSPFTDIYEGDALKQIDAIRSYLSLGKSMALPVGIVPKGGVGMELIPAERPIVHRTFMKEVGPRAILAGYPEKLNVAFDANVVRLAKIWRGRYFDQSGVASGRTDTFHGPLGEDVLDMPEGPAFAMLASNDAPWPAVELTDRDIGGNFKGYRLDAKGRPIYRYTLDGVNIEEYPEPQVRPGGTVFTRHISLSSESPVEGLYFIAARGDSITSLDGAFRVDGKVTVQPDASGGAGAFVRQQNGKAELLIPVSFTLGEADVDVSYQW